MRHEISTSDQCFIGSDQCVIGRENRSSTSLSCPTFSRVGNTKLTTRYTYRVLLASSLAAAIPTVVFAQIVIRNGTSPLPSGAEPQTCCNVDARVDLTLGVVSTLSIGKSFKTIAIGDSKVVDATAQSDRFSTRRPSLRQRLSHASVRSTSQRLGSTTNPLAWSERLTICVCK